MERSVPGRDDPVDGHRVAARPRRLQTFEACVSNVGDLVRNTATAFCGLAAGGKVVLVPVPAAMDRAIDRAA
jgi:hypothetical protein